MKKTDLEKMFRRIIREEIRSALESIIEESVNESVASLREEKRPAAKRQVPTNSIRAKAKTLDDVLEETRRTMTSADKAELDSHLMEAAGYGGSDDSEFRFSQKDARGFGMARSMMTEYDDADDFSDSKPRDTSSRQKAQASQMIRSMDFTGVGAVGGNVGEDVINALTRDYSDLVKAMDKKKRR